MVDAGEWQLAPLRSVSDFILESARFQLPNIKDLEKWGNRVVKNLLYYQTNYFVMSALLITLIGIMNPSVIIIGIASVVAVYLVLTKVLVQSVQGPPDAQPNKLMVLGGMGAVIFLILYLFEAILITMFTILLPFSAIFVHASLRLRNMKSKITTTMEIAGMKQSIMGKFLETMNLLPDAF